ACRCGRQAAVWCGGGRCRAGRAWCAEHHVRHPGDPSVAYCADCYGDRFPACTEQGCTATGYLRCEYREAGEKRSCGRRVCAEHLERWSVYPASVPGLALCGRHMGLLRRQEPEALLERLLFLTEARRGRRGRAGRAALPRLRVLRHIVINTTRQVRDMETLDAMCRSVQRRWEQTRGGPPDDRRVREAGVRTLRAHAASRAEDVAAFRAEHVEGRAHYARLLAHLRATGQGELAEGIGFSDYRPRSRILFVHVPPRLRGAFIGRGGERIRELSRVTGVEVAVERGRQ
ncbi:KH domain-containing protein, partial [Streptomyces sp. SID11385]|uniref:KH domain-containing protein n=1 Tax=Streptomyces sp. SID11385 TaxID=2706031 RepID=UPI0013CD51E9